MAGQNFPQIGLRAVFEISGFKRNYTQYQRDLRDIDRATKQTAQNVSKSGQALGGAVAGSFQDLVQQSGALQDLNSIGLLTTGVLDQLEQAFSSLGAGVGVDVQKFDELASGGTALDEALRLSAASMDDAAGAAAGLGTQLISAAGAAALVVTALRASIALVQQSISAYNDLAEATRRVRYQTGLASQEASGWVLAMQGAGLSATTSERALTSFLSKVSALRSEQVLGEEGSNRFAEAIETLGINLENADGNLKSTSELLGDVEEAFRRMGPGAQSAEAATALFGYSGRFLLPVLLSTKLSLSELAQTAEDYGGTLNALSQKEYEDFKKAQFELLVALQGVYNYIAKQWVPVLTQVQRITASSISIWRSLVQIFSGTEPAMRTLADVLELVANALERVNQFLQRAIALAQRYRDILNPLAAASREAAAAEEERAQAMAQAAQAAADARALEEQRQQAIEDTLQSLSELQAQYADKLADIEQDAAQKWEDILVNRQRDAMDRARQEAYRLEDLKYEYDQRLAEIEETFAKRWEDILVNRQREALIRGIQLAYRYEDLARNAERSRQDAIRDARERGEAQQRDFQRRREELERDAQRRREELEREHQRRLRDIRQQFIDTATEAARRNDAVAVARAQRERARAMRDEQQRYDDEREDLRRSLEERRNDIELDRRQREEDQRRELERTLRRIEENYARQREELVRENERERLLREIRYRWELEDLEAAKAEQVQAAKDWLDKQLSDWRLAKKREDEERAIQYKREEDDLNAAYQRRIDDLIAWYEEERNDLAEHLNLTGQQLEAAYADWARAAAEAAAEIARAAADAVAQEIERYQHLLTEAERARAQATPTPGTLPPPLQTRKNAQGVYVPVVPGAPVLSQAEGGVVQANAPTHIVMGDAGPETAVFLPGRSSTLNVNHNFGRMGVDFAGLPGGMSTARVEGIVYSVLTQLAKGIQVPRR